jgi:hypothetical protein
MTEVLQVTIPRKHYRKYVLDDAQNANDWPEDELHEVIVGPGELTIEGTPEAIRWLYDYMNWAADAFRLEGGEEYAKACEAIGRHLWEAISDDPPSRQRPKKKLR